MDDWTPQRRSRPGTRPVPRKGGLFTITDLPVHDSDPGVHDADLTVHDPDPGVHDGPIQVFTMVRNTHAVLDEARLDVSKVEALRASVPTDLANRFDSAPAPTLRLLDAWTYVNQAPFGERPNVDAFLKGDMPNWGLLSGGNAFERDVEPVMYDAVLDLVTGSARVSTVILLAPAGYGTSTVLMSLALRLVRDKAAPVFMHRRGRELREGDILFAAGLGSQMPVFLVDNASDNKREIAQAIQRCRDEKRPSIFILGERLNEWQARYPKVRGKEFRLEALSDGEIERLIDVLSRHGALGNLAHLSRELRFAAIKEKHEKQLLVAMREATEGKSFDAILEDEYRGMDEPLSQQLYEAVCCAYQIRCYVRDGVLSEALGIGLPELYSRTKETSEGIVEFDSIDERRGLFAARARHHVIARVVWERCVSAENKARTIDRLLGALNLGYHTDVQLLDGFIRNDLIVDSIRGLEGKIRFFDTAAKKRPDDPYVLQHYARMLLREGKSELALAQIDRAIALDSRVRVLHHTRGMVLAALARGTETVEIARRRLAQAEEEFRKSIGINERDPYPYQSLAELYLDWAKRLEDNAEGVAYLAKAEEAIGEGLAKAWDREGLWIVSAKVQEWLGNRPEATNALERAVAETPGSVVARYILGVRLLERGEPGRAVEVLQPLVTKNPHDFRPCIAYAMAQVESGDGYEAAIATLGLGELFGSRDARFIATLGGMQFMNGDFTDADATFRGSAEREFSFEEQTAIRYRPPGKPGSPEKLRMVGEVMAVRGGYAFIRTPGYEKVFYRGSRISGEAIRVGLSVDYELGFSARGPVALGCRRALQTAVEGAS